MLKLKELRKKVNKTQTEVAQALGTSVQVLSRYELGDREPDYNTLQKLADYFGVSVDYLLGREDKMAMAQQNGVQLDENEKTLIENYRELSEQRKELLIEKSVDYLEISNLEKKAKNW